MVRRAAVALTLALAAVLASPAGAASAHPLGNFTVNVFSGLRVQPDRVRIDLVVDMAEIPTYQARKDIDADGDGSVADGEAQGYADRACRAAAGRVDVAVDGHAAAVRSEAAEVAFPAGAGGLPTLRLTCSLAAAASGRAVTFRNRNYDDRVGWREIVAVGDGVELAESTVPTTSLSARLTQYPQDLLQSPPDQRTASFTVRPGGVAAVAGGAGTGAAPVTAAARGVDRFGRAFTGLIARRHLTVAFGLLAVGLSVVLGALHALAPGHGKTLMAAYLVGRRGSFGDALLIGVTMATTHTAGVLALGILLSASTDLAAETLYPWLGLVSGLLLAGIGASLLCRAAQSRAGGHDHAHPHPHPHPDLAPVPLGRRGLVGMGFVGGLLPSPSALVVLLGAIALGRAWFGVVLVGAYGTGMAGTLLATALVLVRAQAGIAARLTRPDRGPVARLLALLPAATATAVLLAGLFFAVQGASRI